MISLLKLRGWLVLPMVCAPWLAAGADELPCSDSPAEQALSASDNGAAAGLHVDSRPIRVAALSPEQIKGLVDYSADHFSTNANGVTVLSGNATVNWANRMFSADKITYDRTRNELQVEGQVRYTDPIVHIEGDTGFYTELDAQFSNARFQFLQRPGRGTAQSMDMHPGGIFDLRRVTYTSCPPNRSDWQIRARELTLDTTANRGVGHGARVDFEGIPLIYLPWISFPLSNTRQSGFLYPTFGTNSRSGLTLGTPWYWNIAPNQDMTLTPTIYGNRGEDGGVEYRFLTAESRGTVAANYLPNDRVYGGDRSHERITDRLELPDNWRADVAAENVSDPQYFEDFAQGSQATSTAFLPRDLQLSHRDDVWQFNAQLLQFQTLDQTLAPADRPYVQLPRLTAASLWSPLPLPDLHLGFDSEFVNFTRNSGVTGARLDLRPKLDYDLQGPGYYLRPSAAWEYTQYALRDTGGADNSPSRNLPILTVDSGLQFERLAGANGVRNYTLEPRLMYVYIPYREQSQLPIFDTAPPDANIIELFQPNRYVGVDRVGDANQVTAALTTNMFESASGMRYLSATIGRTFALQSPQVTLPAEVLAANPSSGIVSEIDLTAYRHWTMQLDVATAHDISQISRTDVNLQYRPDGGKVANFGYRFQQGVIQQADASFAWPVSHHWDAYGRAVYSLLGHQSIDDFAGFQFRGDCWGMRAVVRRSLSTRTGERDTGFYLQLELTGLSNVGTGADAFLQQSIRGYSPPAGTSL
jgi:LPS-assembly protein